MYFMKLIGKEIYFGNGMQMNKFYRFYNLKY